MTKIDPGVTVGHIHLRVSDLDRSITFYRDLLGFEVTQRVGDVVAFLSAGGYHHHIGLNTLQSQGASAPPPGHTGLYHVAFLFPNRQALATTVQRLLAAKVVPSGATDHGVSEAIYLNDPDGNGIELYVDRDPANWPRDADGHIEMRNSPLDLQALLGACVQT